MTGAGLTVKPFTANVIAIIRQIPAGQVMTYGQIARAAGSPRAARQVVRILHAMSKKHNLPWHRVINSKGEIGLRDSASAELQAEYLREEGVEIAADRLINLARYQYHPDETILKWHEDEPEWY
ncbi:MGMT family protein [Brevibacillus fluminis]|uniref:MGMT family protein n=1 Tax=Brevibacillus fluminis TaxID=511487 RepID=UPI003F8B8A98